jgi:hypothetical protein
MLMMLIHWAEVYILYGKTHETSVVVSKENRLEVNDDKTMYMVTSRDQNAVQSQNIKIHNSSFEGV